MMCTRLLEKMRFLCKVCFSGKLIFRKYANSENFANSEITPEDFANSETGAKIFSFSKNCHFVSRALVAIGGCFYNLLGNQHSL
jgi:hypothetical protein